MKEHPILFKPDMIKAIRAGRKTQTRRVPVERYRNWQVGDRIWVREKFGYVWPEWCEYGMIYDVEGGRSITPEDCDIVYYADNPNIVWYDMDDNECYLWKPSIHMPRWASRITLEITGLREEPVHDISYEDILCEGWDSRTSEPFLNDTAGVDAREWFCRLWDSINKKRGYGWDANPIAKVIEFKLIEKDSNFGHYFWPY